MSAPAQTHLTQTKDLGKLAEESARIIQDIATSVFRAQSAAIHSYRKRPEDDLKRRPVSQYETFRVEAKTVWEQFAMDLEGYYAFSRDMDDLRGILKTNRFDQLLEMRHDMQESAKKLHQRAASTCAEYAARVDSNWQELVAAGLPSAWESRIRRAGKRSYSSSEDMLGYTTTTQRRAFDGPAEVHKTTQSIAMLHFLLGQFAQHWIECIEAIESVTSMRLPTAAVITRLLEATQLAAEHPRQVLMAKATVLAAIDGFIEPAGVDDIRNLPPPAYNNRAWPGMRYFNTFLSGLNRGIDRSKRKYGRDNSGS